MNMLLAVLEKRAGFKLVQKDVFLNIAGGIRLADPASDLAVITAVLSSSLDIALPEGVCLTGEVGYPVRCAPWAVSSSASWRPSVSASVR